MKKLLLLALLLATTSQLFAQEKKYDNQSDYSNRLVLAKKSGLYGFVDKNGKEVIPFIYEYAHDFSEGLAAVVSRENSVWGFIDKSGKVVIDFKYVWVGQPYELPYKSFENGYVAVQPDSKKIGLIDRNGNVVVPFSEEFAYIYKAADGMFKVGDRLNKFGFVNEAGKLIVPLIYDEVWNFSEGLAPVLIKSEKEQKVGFIGKTGEIVIPLNYEFAYSFSDGLAKVRKNGKDFFIDKAGKVAFSSKYDYVLYKNFTNGLCVVTKGKDDNKKYGYMDKNGKLAIPFDFEKAGEFDNGIASVKKNGSYVIINTDGQIVQSFDFAYLSDFHDGMAKYKDKYGDEFGFINAKGKKITACIYQGIYDFENGKVRVRKKDGKWITIDKNGLEI